MAEDKTTPNTTAEDIANMSIEDIAQNAGPRESSAAMPPSMAKKREYTADELVKEMNRVPLFMTSIDETDEEQTEQLEALKALAYEGTRAEIAANFKDQGNECVQRKNWFDAREFYSKAITALRDPNLPQYEAPDVKVVEIDEEAEAMKERALEEASLANRALCNLEMKNYGSCNRDCAAALRINPRNVKAWYRAASACLALDKIDEAIDACQGGLKWDPNNTALKTLSSKVIKRRDTLHELNHARQQREQLLKTEQSNLQLAMKSRGFSSITTPKPPDMEDAAPKLTDPANVDSLLNLPVLFLYPLHAQTDLIKSVGEDESLGQHLSYVLPPPWDEPGEYQTEHVDCYMETNSGGLIKAGKKLSLAKLLGGGKVAIVDGMVKVNLVPKSRANEWIDEYKKRRGKQ